MIRRQPDLTDLDREIQEHIDAETVENVARGMTPTEARTAALRTFGNVTRVREDVGEVWAWAWWDHLRQDVRDAVRRFRCSPALAVSVAATLALGIGVSTAIFSVVNAMLIRPLSYPHPDRVVWFTEHDGRGEAQMLNGLDFVDWKEQATSFDHMSAYYFDDSTVVVDGEASRWRIMSASDGFWALSGATAALGALPEAGDDERLVLSHRVFQQRFRGDPGVIGRVVDVGGEPRTVAAVLTPDFAPQLPPWSWRAGNDRIETDAYQGMSLPTAVRDRSQVEMVPIVLAIGQIKAGVTIDQARAELETIQERIRQQPMTWQGRSFAALMPLEERLVGSYRFPLQLLLGAALCVLLITCANVTSLLLSRSSARQREIALRMAVGGGAGRVIRQLLAESVAYALVGCGLGIVLAQVLLAVIVDVVGGTGMPRLNEITLDVFVLSFAVVIAMVTALTFGLGPALVLGRTRVLDVLKSGGAAMSASRHTLLAGRVSVAVQMTLAVVLLIGAGLMAKSLWRMTAYPPGFVPDQILTLRVEFSGAAYRQTEARHRHVEALLARARSLPGVDDVAITDDRAGMMVVVKEGEGRPEDPEAHGAPVSTVSASFGPMIGMSLVRGRWFSDLDATNQVLINDALAQREFPGVDPIGRRIQLPGVDNRGLATIVGIVRDLKYARLDAEAEPELFVHYKARRLFGVTLALRVVGDPLAAAPGIARALGAVDPTQALFAVKTLEQRLAESIAPRRFNLLLLGVFAIVALILVALGIYGVVAYAVSERTHEIGIRLALGADRTEVVSMIVRQALRSIVAGLAAGLAVTILTMPLMASLLYDVGPTDVPTFVTATATLAAIAVIACAAPALRAATVNPVAALRAD